MGEGVTWGTDTHMVSDKAYLISVTQWAGIFVYELSSWELGKCKSFQTIHEIADPIKLQICKAEDQTLVYNGKKSKKSILWSPTSNSHLAEFIFQDRIKINIIYWALTVDVPDTDELLYIPSSSGVLCALLGKRGRDLPAMEWRLVVPKYHRSTLLLGQNLCWPVAK